MTIILVILSLLTALAGIASLSQATTGVGILIIACLFAILGRMAQAHAYHREIHPAQTFVPIPGPGPSSTPMSWPMRLGLNAFFLVLAIAIIWAALR